MKTRPALLLPLLSLACAGQLTAPPDHPLVGTFEWVASQGGIAGTEITPEEAGFTIRARFQAGTVLVYRDGELVAGGQFTAEVDPQQLSPVVFFVEYRPSPGVFPFTAEEHTVRLPGEDQLSFDEGCCDRFVHLFRKVPAGR